ncbi:MAG TPA: nitrilase-related carbon-nitrogen hydrolase, partial [Thermoanaerobaculia bacterium]
MKLALAQLSSSADHDANLTRALAAIDEAAAQGADVIVYPEIV